MREKQTLEVIWQCALYSHCKKTVNMKQTYGLYIKKKINYVSVSGNRNKSVTEHPEEFKKKKNTGTSTIGLCTFL